MSCMQARMVFLDWYLSSSQGLGLQCVESAYLQEMIKISHNQSILQVGELGDGDLGITSPYDNMTLCQLDKKSSLHLESRICLAQAELLPFMSESFDFCLLPHVLEFHDYPREVLQECVRILKPEGHLYILGFNPWHLQGLMHCLPQSSHYQLLNLISYPRLVEWLKSSKLTPELAAGFSIDQPQLRMASSRISHVLAQLAPVYAIRAIKRRYNIIHPNMAWKNIHNLMATPGLETACRSMIES